MACGGQTTPPKGEAAKLRQRVEQARRLASGLSNPWADKLWAIADEMEAEGGALERQIAPDAAEP